MFEWVSEWVIVSGYSTITSSPNVHAMKFKLIYFLCVSTHVINDCANSAKAFSWFRCHFCTHTHTQHHCISHRCHRLSASSRISFSHIVSKSHINTDLCGQWIFIYIVWSIRWHDAGPSVTNGETHLLLFYAMAIFWIMSHIKWHAMLEIVAQIDGDAVYDRNSPILGG